MVEHDAGWTQRLNDFMSLFGDAFRRRDQARWASVYIQALLTVDGRKTINRLAQHVTLPPELTAEDAAQALQNFVNQSPWDEQNVWRRYRTLLAERLDEPEGLFVVDDLTFAKQGRHSVGVQRQYSSALGRKTNCQIAVALYHVGAAGCCPLGLRLYLPRTWLQQPQRLDAVGVPQENRDVHSKIAIALELLDEARRDGWSTRRVLGSAGFGADQDFHESLNSRGFVYRSDAPANAKFAEHVLMSRLGLDHFEGRSWRGFHHHACLVMLAYAFRLLNGCTGDCPPAETVAVGV